MQIVPSLWIEGSAEEAARFYARALPDSRVDRVTVVPGDSPSGPEGAVVVAEMTLLGQPFTVMQARGGEAFSQAVSFTILCDTQAEVDRLWDALQEGGGRPVACGWLRDRHGLSWQVCPRRMYELMADPDRDRARRATAAMMGMVKLDIAGLERAAA